MRPNSTGGCLTAFAVAFSRFFLFFAWLARPIAFQAAFGGSWILPCLGIMVLPFTTFMYLLLVTNGGISGFDYVWLGLSVLLDIAGAGAAAANNRNYIPQGVPGSLPPSAS